MEAAEKYLTELDYEQAIAEYTLALEIESNNEEALNALEQTYLDYAQSLADAGEYEKAVSVLEEGYAQIGRESLREKMEYVKSRQVKLPFQVSDITVMGYDLLEQHYDEMVEELGILLDEVTPDAVAGKAEFLGGTVYAFDQDGGDDTINDRQLQFHIPGDGDNYIYYYNDRDSSRTYLLLSDVGRRNEIEAICNLPFYPGDTYEEWCEIFEIEKIRESWDGTFDEECNRSFYHSSTDSVQIFSRDGWQVFHLDDRYDKRFDLKNEDMWFCISVEFEDGIAMHMEYWSYSENDNE